MKRKKILKISGVFLGLFILLILGQKTLDLLQIEYQREGVDLLEMILLLICMISFSWALVQESDEEV